MMPLTGWGLTEINGLWLCAGVEECDLERPMPGKSFAGRPCNPTSINLDIAALHGRPGRAVRDFILAGFAGILREGVIEGLAIDILGVSGQVTFHRVGQVGVAAVRHC